VVTGVTSLGHPSELNKLVAVVVVLQKVIAPLVGCGGPHAFNIEMLIPF
jgi:hypothetical protein